MEMSEDEENEPSAYAVALLYAVLSFVCVIVFILIVLVTCSRKYRLNWFEKNLLESASTRDLEQSQETLVQDFVPGSSKSLCSNSGEEKFWVPHNVKKMSICPSDNDGYNTSPEDSVPESPTSSISYQLVPGPVPIARNEKHVILTNTSPVRPKLATMQSKLDYTKIDTSLYQTESPVELEDVRGSLHITLTYDPIAEILTVRLVEAQDLQARDFSGTADPYAKIRLLPDKTNVWQTRIHKKTLNPVFDEDFVFEVKAATLFRHTLEILLYDFDAFSRHNRIGTVQLALSSIDLSDKVDFWKGLTPCLGHDSHLDLGELMVSLAYLPSAERLTVVVIKARNLRVVDDTRNSSDPYVKVTINQGSKKLKKRKTGVHRNTVNPIFNEALTFDIGKNTLRKCIIEFCVMHDSLLGASEILGKARVGQTPECKRHEKEFFADMFHSKTATAQWLPLAEVKGNV